MRCCGSRSRSSRTLISVRMSLSSTMPPTMPPFASSVEFFRPMPKRNLRWPLESMEIEPSHIRFRVSQLALPMTLPMFMEMFRLEKLTVRRTSVSQGLLTMAIMCDIFFIFRLLAPFACAAFFFSSAELSRLNSRLVVLLLLLSLR